MFHQLAAGGRAADQQAMLVVAPRHPERFAAIRAAYEGLRDRETRLRLQVFRHGTKDSVETILEEVRCPSSRPRVSLRTLLGLVRKS